ncbi:MAG: glucosaminidase domain-containing protein [Alphaproteobacteria bacterium]|nr:glucosaminidase domain-containing protein [Alphaproteobacteria bacterium]
MRTAKKRKSRRRFERAALAVLAACVTGLYGLSLTTGFGQKADIPMEVLIARGLLPPALGDSDEERPQSSQLAQAFHGMGYDLTSVARGERVVPRLYLANLPSDLDDINDSTVRKALFLRTMLPLVLSMNETILADRKRLLAYAERARAGLRVIPAERDWLNDLAQRYDVEDGDLFTLFQRVDAIPPSLALAQAAEESGWGTSRFAQEGNALFGQWTHKEGKGLIPTDRAPNAGFAVKSFASLAEAVRAYALNLNTHQAYQEFREARWTAREANLPLDGLQLTDTLHRYSERGDDYVETLRKLIRQNGLAALDEARLGNRALGPSY